MTLQSLSPHLEVHCGHYRVCIGDPAISVADPFSVPGWFAGDTWTVLRVPLESGALSADEVDAWLAEWADSALLFLGNVGSVTHLDEHVRGVVGHGDVERVVGAAVHAPELDDLLVGGHGGLELLDGLAVVRVDLYVDEHLDAAAQRLGVDEGSVSANDAGLFQAFDPAQARRCGQTDPLVRLRDGALVGTWFNCPGGPMCEGRRRRSPGPPGRESGRRWA